MMTCDPSEAIQRLIDKNIMPNLESSPEASIDSNDFRRTRLYTENVDQVLKANLKMLKTLFKGACKQKRGSREKRMSVEEYNRLLATLDLFDEDFTKREGTLTFRWSQMSVSDEVRNVLEYRTILFTDFMEALGRVADLKSFPTREEIAAFNEDDTNSNYGILDYLFDITVSRKGDAYPDRQSQELSAPKTQPLAYKLECLLAVIGQRAFKKRLI